MPLNVAVFTAGSLRHMAFATMAKRSESINVVATFHEEGNSLKDLIDCRPQAELERQHLYGRDQAEKDFFCLYLDSCKLNATFRPVPRQWFSTQDCLDTMKEPKIDLILVYGTSIIRGPIIDEFKGRILNLHLGLSPYYRGSGTNYFPFVNNEPEFCGATFMYLDEGVDTGQIIHQIRPNILPTDSFHQLSNRFLIRAFKTYIVIAEGFHKIKGSEPTDSRCNATRRLYRDRDFTASTVEQLYENFASGMISAYLDNYLERNARAPIVHNFIFDQKIAQ